MAFSDKEFRILGTLEDGRERYGAQLAGLIPGASKRTIYVFLARLLAKGQVQSRVAGLRGPNSQPVRLYKITRKGHSQLKRARGAFAG